MFCKVALIIFTYFIGTQTAEVHPTLSWSKCAAGGACTQTASSIVLDVNWHWLHSTIGYTNCCTGNEWDVTLCPDPTTSTSNCALDSADYTGTYGITTSSDALTLKFITTGVNTNVDSHVYLMADATHYEVFDLLNQEFTFDVDVSNLPCGLNGMLYFSEMDADSGVASSLPTKLVPIMEPVIAIHSALVTSNVSMTQYT